LISVSGSPTRDFSVDWRHGYAGVEARVALNATILLTTMALGSVYSLMPTPRTLRLLTDFVEASAGACYCFRPPKWR